MIVLCESLLVIDIPYSAVYHLWEVDQNYPFAILSNIGFWCDNIIGHETNLISVFGIAAISVPWVPSLKSY